MNTVWTLIIILYPGYNWSNTIVINQMPSYAECARMEKVVLKRFVVSNETEYSSACIEVFK